MKKTLKAVTIAAGLALLAAPVSSFAAGTTAVQHHNQWVKKGAYWTYYNANGALHKGWLKQNSKWYYLDANGNMKTGWALVSGKWYFFEASGAMKTGWAKVGNQWYYLDGSGSMKMGWVKVSNQWYFLDSSGAMKTGWAKVSNQWYYLDRSGAMKTGWIELADNVKYYLSASGAMKTGWLKDAGKWYFFDRTSGEMTVDWKDIDGKTYYFYSDGHMMANKTIGGKKIGADGAVYEDHSAEMMKTIEGIVADSGLTMQYQDETKSYNLYLDDDQVGAFRVDGGVVAFSSYEGVWKKIALALDVPLTEAELNELMEQSRQTGEIRKDDLNILVNDKILFIMWNFE
ncbi:hypothetical protein [Bacillus sp. SORGH_AS_0510]|uniref:hypothetical protein n=1 Tax=Bacillus sp. SORGH_AS_0510 TaxID=3041771 RepID=UPI0027D87451|nr:hypothetical protein [Bacillus sp. SORGH_AS_0510]